MPITGITFSATPIGHQVLLTLFADGAAEVTVERLTAANTWLVVRGAFEAPAPDGWAGYDYEAPQGRILTYRATITGGGDTEVVTVDTPFPLDHEGDWIMPVGSWELGMNVFVEFDGIGEKEHGMIQDAVPVLNRTAPVAVSWGRLLPRGNITFLTLEDQDRRDFLRVVDFPVIMFAARNGFGYDEPAFLSISTINEGRTSGLGSEASRRWTVECQEIERPPAVYDAPPPLVSWTDIEGTYATWNDLVPAGNWYEVAGYA